jgi:kynurenine formamidase
MRVVDLTDVRPGDIVLFRSDNAPNWGTDAYWHGWCYPDAAASAALVRAGAGLIIIAALMITRPDQVRTFGRAFDTSGSHEPAEPAVGEP